jgi:hypothetical protein
MQRVRSDEMATARQPVRPQQQLQTKPSYNSASSGGRSSLSSGKLGI